MDISVELENFKVSLSQCRKRQSLPSAQPFVTTITTIIPYSRTTVCDIQCTVNTFKEWVDFDNTKGGPKKSDRNGTSATLPKRKTTKLTSTEDGATPFQRLKLAEAHRKHNEDLIREKNEYFKKIISDKKRVFLHRHECAIKIQALFRGFRKRPKPKYFLKSAKKVFKFSIIELQDELCTLASNLNLRPIPGLSLEFRPKKNSKRRMRFENAAAYRIQVFFSMIYARKKAREYMSSYKIKQATTAAQTIVRFFRYIAILNFTKKCDVAKRHQMAAIIQRNVRGYLARLRHRDRRKEVYHVKRQDEAATIIVRAFALKARKVAQKNKAREELKIKVLNKKIQDLSNLVVASFFETYTEEDLVDLVIGTAIAMADAKEAEELRIKGEKARIESLTNSRASSAVDGALQDFFESFLSSAINLILPDIREKIIAQEKEEAIRQALEHERQLVLAKEREEARRLQAIELETESKATDATNAVMDEIISDIMVSNYELVAEEGVGIEVLRLEELQRVKELEAIRLQNQLELDRANELLRLQKEAEEEEKRILDELDKQRREAEDREREKQAMEVAAAEKERIDRETMEREAKEKEEMERMKALKEYEKLSKELAEEENTKVEALNKAKAAADAEASRKKKAEEDLAKAVRDEEEALIKVQKTEERSNDAASRGMELIIEELLKSTFTDALLEITEPPHEKYASLGNIEHPSKVFSENGQSSRGKIVDDASPVQNPTLVIDENVKGGGIEIPKGVVSERGANDRGSLVEGGDIIDSIKHPNIAKDERVEKGGIENPFHVLEENIVRDEIIDRSEVKTPFKEVASDVVSRSLEPFGINANQSSKVVSENMANSGSSDGLHDVQVENHKKSKGQLVGEDEDIEHLSVHDIAGDIVHHIVAAASLPYDTCK